MTARRNALNMNQDAMLNTTQRQQINADEMDWPAVSPLGGFLGDRNNPRASLRRSFNVSLADEPAMPHDPLDG